MSQKHVLICSEVRITSANNTLDFKEAGVARTATLTDGLYFLYGNGTETGTADVSNSSGDLLANIKTAMDLVAATNTYDVLSNFWQASTHIGSEVTFLSSTDNVEILTTGTFDTLSIGFSVASTAATTATSDVSACCSWMCDQPFVDVLKFGITSAFSQHFTASGKPYSFELKSKYRDLDVQLSNVSKRRTWYFDDLTNKYDSFELFWERIRGGQLLRMYLPAVNGVASNVGSTDLYMNCVVNLDKTDAFDASNVGLGTQLYSFNINLRQVSF